MNLLITGSSGYLGRNFLETVKNDDNLYFFLVRSKKKILKFKKIKNIEFIECDLKKYDEVKKKIKKLSNRYNN